MISKASGRPRSMMLISVLAGVMIGILGGLFVSFAQGEDYFCPDGYQTCQPDEWGDGGPGNAFDPWMPYGGDTGGGGGGSVGTCDNGRGIWTCPTKEVGQQGTGGTGTCTSNGCGKSSTQPDSYWVCRFTASDSQTKCPPLEECECRSK